MIFMMGLWFHEVRPNYTEFLMSWCTSCVVAPIRQFDQTQDMNAHTYQYKYFHECWASWERLDSPQTLWYCPAQYSHRYPVSSVPHGGAYHHPLSRLPGSESELDLTPVRSWTPVGHSQLQSQVMNVGHIQNFWMLFISHVSISSTFLKEFFNPEHV